MKATVKRAFVQLGATRDGLDPYLACAARRDMTTVLVETPAYLRWRRVLHRQPFGIEIPVSEPEDAEQVAAALRTHRVVPALLLAGFERYAESAFSLAATLRVAPWPHVGADFAPPDKLQQRTGLTRYAPEVLQPRHVHLPLSARGELGPAHARALEGMAFPQVVKPVDGAGGLGVFQVRDTAERERAVRAAAATTNYGGAAFTGLLVEEHVEGTEYSVQGIAWNGEARLLSFCEKVILPEADHADGLRGFREAGHIAASGAVAPRALQDLAQSCLGATGYRHGPFHIDAISNGVGPHFLEMGFRLSGSGLVALVERATGLRWAELVFSTHLDGLEPPAAPYGNGRRAVGQLVATQAHQLERARDLAASHPGVHVELTRKPAGPEELLPDDEAPLASDHRRHAVVRGRVLLEGDRTDQIRDWLYQCATAERGV
ncbi:ATP-grasp domain-containing protein [Streptomyces sp. NPDC003038]|uniref:ATP-grasp domain-containing protein n=1 Tax=unclassified Streptomyces TaxID=2593676 RepID=UPI0033A7DF02